jgi:hypothetical protein
MSGVVGENQRTTKKKMGLKQLIEKDPMKTKINLSKKIRLKLKVLQIINLKIIPK